MGKIRTAEEVKLHRMKVAKDLMNRAIAAQKRGGNKMVEKECEAYFLPGTGNVLVLISGQDHSSMRLSLREAVRDTDDFMAAEPISAEGSYDWSAGVYLFPWASIKLEF